jgi:hypothetical protein
MTDGTADPDKYEAENQSALEAYDWTRCTWCATRKGRWCRRTA